jgi:PAS domain S-box-containing protein
MRTPKFWESRIHFEEAARTHRVLAELPAQAQGRLSLEYRFLHADGRYHWLKDDLRLIRNAEGLPLEIEGHWLDVTDRRRLEESLSDEAARYHKLAETVGEIVWTRDAEGHTIAISPNAREILGFEPGELLNMRRRLWWKRIQPEDAVRVRAAFQGLILDGRPYTVDYRIKRSDESWLEVREKGIVRRKNDGLVLADGTVVELIRDRESAIADFIDERRRLEGLLQRSEERFRLLVDNMPSGVAVYEPRDDGRDFIIKDFNRAAGLARAIAGELGLPRDKVEEIHIGGRLHDIGMISLPLKILSKPGKVTDIEFERLKTHTKLGADIVRKADFSPGRDGLPRWPEARGNRPRGHVPGGGRRGRSHVVRPAAPPRRRHRQGPRGDRAEQGRPLRRARRGHLPDDLPGERVQARMTPPRRGDRRPARAKLSSSGPPPS